MNKFAAIILLSINMFYCNRYEKEIDQLAIAKRHFTVLDDSNYSKVDFWFSDSLIIEEGSYKQVYSKNEYIELLKWDSVFDPSYEIIELLKLEKGVKARISKLDKRIAFLHGKPFITNQTLRFEKSKIVSIEIEYSNFNDSIWSARKNELLRWIEKNHPELNGFIYDQTESGGEKFLRALELYQLRH
ncbi:hypothetical protein [Robertkochia aurantiaca]|uniref:hypothetical protein n=1 Tax=Robertkochia aurantiaca TaxID=2873700 RepID=UPI001CCA8016|nr:hypothetical protein [Robertkochia sp. 3YJGBD-33]